ncbi:hypothetical protein [Crenobacter cavernae]|uniref:Uncharacterized protein n=1 Tax=Crenobacter cavernae TaxID=2290923 RepID=A0ABY0FFK9_9NEIS|nr:hypothetical protein [Crenobacter cavernae]RXZ45020.1 hypothetical protein EBB06_03775 [Crenobacter cavernae]
MQGFNWLWLLLIVGPIVTVIGTLARLAKKEPPPDLPDSAIPGRRFDADARREATRAALEKQGRPRTLIEPRPAKPKTGGDGHDDDGNPAA